MTSCCSSVSIIIFAHTFCKLNLQHKFLVNSYSFCNRTNEITYSLEIFILFWRGTAARACSILNILSTILKTPKPLKTNSHDQHSLPFTCFNCISQLQFFQVSCQISPQSGIKNSFYTNEGQRNAGLSTDLVGIAFKKVSLRRNSWKSLTLAPAYFLCSTGSLVI